jgi:hypothetical protein
MCGETGHQCQPLGILQVRDHALLVAIHELKQGALAVAECADVAVIIAACGLDLHHVRAEIGQQCRAVGFRQHPREVENPYAGERTAGAARRWLIVHAHHPHWFWTSQYRRTEI